jgi:hypothetical protein
MVTPVQAYVFETMGSAALLFLLFGVGINPHQKHTYGPAYSVVLVCLSFGLVSFISWPVIPGYSGVCKLCDKLYLVLIIAAKANLRFISAESSTMFWANGRK